MAQTSFTGPVKSNGGFIENSFTTAQRDALSPVVGLLIYNTDLNIYQVYGNSGWQTAFGPTPSNLRIDGVNPISGSTNGGNPVSIIGAGFTSVTSVQVDTTYVSFSTYSDSTIGIGSMPSHSAGSVSVKVYAPGGASSTAINAYTYNQAANPPQISYLSPNSGSTNGGTYVSIVGSGLSNLYEVAVDGSPVSYQSFGDNYAAIPAMPSHSAGSANVTVYTSAGTSTASYTYVQGATPPQVSYLSPNSGATTGGNYVSIVGSGFSGTYEVDVAGSSVSYQYISDNYLGIPSMPSHSAGSVSVTVHTSAGTSTGYYSYVAGPSQPYTVNTGTGKGGLGLNGGFAINPQGTVIVQQQGFSILSTPLYTPWDPTAAGPTAYFPLSTFIPGGYTPTQAVAFDSTGYKINTVMYTSSGMGIYDLYPATINLQYQYNPGSITGVTIGTSPFATGVGNVPTGLSFGNGYNNAYVTLGVQIYSMAYFGDWINASGVQGVVDINGSYGLSAYNATQIAFSTDGRLAVMALNLNMAGPSPSLFQIPLNAAWNMASGNSGAKVVTSLSGLLSPVDSVGGVAINTATNSLMIIAGTYGGGIPAGYGLSVTPN